MHEVVRRTEEFFTQKKEKKERLKEIVKEYSKSGEDIHPHPQDPEEDSSEGEEDEMKENIPGFDLDKVVEQLSREIDGNLRAVAAKESKQNGIRSRKNSELPELDKKEILTEEELVIVVDLRNEWSAIARRSKGSRKRKNRSGTTPKYSLRFIYRAFQRTSRGMKSSNSSQERVFSDSTMRQVFLI
jgi:hypothetical protein